MTAHDSRRSRAGWTLATVGVLALALDCGTPAKTCCPLGPPYEPACSESFYYYFHGNQLQPGPSFGNVFLNQAPWRHLGRVHRAGGGSGSGVLIHDRFVLTAAHVVMDGGDFGEGFVTFALAQPCADCLPYGSRAASRLWVPEEWIDNIGGDTDSAETRAYDWALLELDLDANNFNPGVPAPVPMGATQQGFSSFDHLTPRAAGYGCGRQANGTLRQPQKPYATDGSGSFLGQTAFAANAEGARGGAIFRTSLEGTAGMSGGPVWIEQSGQPLLVGVLIGSPQAACDDGENWVAGLSATTRQRILSVIANGAAPGMVSHTPTSGGAGFQLCDNLFSPAQSPCPPSLDNPGPGEVPPACVSPEG